MNIKGIITKAIFILTLVGCFAAVNKESWKINEEGIKEITISEFKEGEFVRKVVLRDKKKIKRLIIALEKNHQELAKFLPRFEATIKFSGDHDSLNLMFRDNFFRSTGKGSFKMKTSIEDIIKELKIFEN